MAALALAILGAAPTVIQGISSLVHGIENLFGHGNGAAKKAAVLQAFGGAVSAYDSVAAAIGDVKPQVKLPQLSGASADALANLVDAIVAFYNATGIFTHAAASAK